MKSGAARVTETAFISTETFTQKTFKRWVENRPRGDINGYELASGRILMTDPVRVKVVRINTFRSEIDFELIATDP